MLSLFRSLVAIGVFIACLADARRVQKSFRLPLQQRVFSHDELSKRATGEVDLSSPSPHVNWNVDLEVGGQNFTLGVDTGSSPLWVLSTQLSSANRTAISSKGYKHNFFDPSKSPSFHNTSSQFSLSYDTGENFLRGYAAIDEVAIAGLTANMTIGLPDLVSENVVPDDADGVFGMAFGVSNQLTNDVGIGQPTFMETIMSQLDEPVFTLNLPVGQSQSLEFGRVDSSLYDGKLQTAAIFNGTSDAGRGWSARVSFELLGRNVSSRLQSTLFDTGGITALANEDVVRAYWGQVKGAVDISAKQDATNWDFPCDSALPDLTYHLLGPDGNFVPATVPGRFFNYTALWRRSYSSTCQGGLQSNGQGGGTMGYAFWHSFFTVFNQSAPSVSFAPYPQKELDALPQVTGTFTTAPPLPTSTGVRIQPPSTPGSGATAAASATSAARAAIAEGKYAGWKGLASGLMAVVYMLG